MTPQAPDAIARAVARLRAGGLVGMPTETVYGLAADAASADAVHAIYVTKGRPAGHPLIVHVAGIPEARRWADWSERAQRLAEAFWPGPLTLVLPRLPGAPDFACGGQPSIGLRAPAHPVARALLRAFHDAGGLGLAAPSANRFGRISPTRAEHVLADLGPDAALVLDGGDAPVGIESTIVDLTRARPVLLRPGAIGPDALAAVLGEPVELSVNLADVRVVDAAAPRVAGSLASHYAPRTPLSVLPATALDAEVAHLQGQGVRCAAWRFAPGRVAADEERMAPATAEDYARALYATLRELDAGGYGRLLLEAPPEAPAWAAVRDRLARAATPA